MRGVTSWYLSTCTMKASLNITVVLRTERWRRITPRTFKLLHRGLGSSFGEMLLPSLSLQRTFLKFLNGFCVTKALQGRLLSAPASEGGINGTISLVSNSESKQSQRLETCSYCVHQAALGSSTQRCSRNHKTLNEVWTCNGRLFVRLRDK